METDETEKKKKTWLQFSGQVCDYLHPSTFLIAYRILVCLEQWKKYGLMDITFVNVQIGNVDLL